jgi:type IV secretory pathway VirB10-like protein
MDFLVDEDEVIIEEEEGTNRTFIILVALLAGLLLVGLCTFGVYMFFVAPRLAGNVNVAQQNQAVEATNTAIAVAAAETSTADAPPTATSTRTPTPEPSATPTEQPTRTPSPTPVELAEGEAGELDDDALTATARSTATRRPTSTPRVTKASGEKVPSTGIGMFAAGLMGAGLLFLLVVVRRLRHTV